VVVWVALKARGMLVNPSDLRRTRVGDLRACTHGERSEPSWAKLPYSMENGKKKGRKEGAGAFRAKAVPAVVMVVQEGLSVGLFIGQQGWFARKYLQRHGAHARRPQ